jgi:hypothetical protein
MRWFGASEAATPTPAERLAAEPGAPRWAELCAWVPGTGHCRDRDCREDCIFRAQCAAEAARMARWRRLRRICLRR